MSEQDNIKLVQGWLTAFGASDWDTVESSLASDHVYEEFGTQRRIEGSGSIVDVMRAWKVAMPDVKGNVRNVVASGDSVVMELTWEGTHTGTLVTADGEIPASGKKQVTPGAMSVEVVNGKMQSSRNYFDLMTFLQQIGAA